MDSQEKSNFVNHLRHYIKNEKEGYKYFLQEWNQLNEEDINSLKGPLYVMCIYEMQQDKFVEPAYFEFQDIANYLIESKEYKPDVKKFNISNAAKDNEIVKIFMRLKNLNYITNTNEEIASLISKVFDIEYGTAHSYLKKPNDQKSVRNLLG